MKISICSDLHLEFEDLVFVNDCDADVLILGGDICNAQDLHHHALPADTADQTAIVTSAGLGRRQQRAQRYRDFFTRCSSQFPNVIYIMGNHEFYNGKFNASVDHMRHECARYSNVHMLEQDMKIIDDVVFVGGTLWTDMNRGDPLTMLTVKDFMNDFSVIRNDQRGYAALSTQDVATRHAHTLDYIRHTVQQHSDKKCVVVGHHAPSAQSIHAKYAHDREMNGAFGSDLDQFILAHPQICLWTHGHMHDSFDYEIGTTRVVCNPRGYAGHESQANSWQLVTVDI